MRSAAVIVPYRLLRTVMIAAGVLYCSLLLEAAAGFPLNVHTSFLSELGARDQPTSPYARAMDLGAGALLLIAAYLGRAGGRRHRDVAGLLIGMAIFGAGTFLDALSPMDCAPSLSAACAAAETSGQDGVSVVLHATTSATAVFGSFVVSFFALLIVRRLGGGGPWGRVVAVLAVAVAVSEIWIGIVMGINALHGDIVTGPGILQRVSVLLICLLLGTLPPVLRQAVTQ